MDSIKGLFSHARFFFFGWHKEFVLFYFLVVSLKKSTYMSMVTFS